MSSSEREKDSRDEHTNNSRSSSRDSSNRKREGNGNPDRHSSGNGRSGSRDSSNRKREGNGNPDRHSSGNGSGNGSGPSNGSKGKGEKRGRDRSNEAGPSKVQRNSEGKGKRREEFYDQPITRPTFDFDKNGRHAKDTNVKLKANYFKMVSQQRISVTLYRVNFEPESEIRGERNNLIGQHQATLGGYLYDGANQMYLLRPLNEDVLSFRSRNREDVEFNLTFKKTREILYTEGSFLQVLNLVVRNALRRLDLQLVGRNFYDANAAIAVRHQQHRLDIWPGYITSVRQHEDDVLLNCEISHKVMRNENVLTIIGECIRRGGDSRAEAERKIIGTTVLTDYNNATYKIDAIDWDQNPSSTFLQRGVETAYNTYYKTKYGILRMDLGQPLLVSRASARNLRAGQPEFILLVPELCRATGITDEMRNEFGLMSAMAAHTRLSPSDRVARLNGFNTRLRENPDSQRVFVENFISLDRELVNIDGRRMPQAVIEFDKKSVDLASRDNADWTNNIAGNVMYKEVMRSRLVRWIYLYPKSCSAGAGIFMENFMKVSSGLCGGQIAEPRVIVIDNDTVMTYTKELETQLGKDPKFIMIIVPNNRGDRYAALKIASLCRDRPVPIQVICERTIKNQSRLMSIATKVSIQVNCKLGGIPWYVNTLTAGLMVIGFDVTHDTQTRRNSYGALVAHLNPKVEGGKFFSVVTPHTNGEQLSANFGINFLGALRKYFEVYGALPARILIYRDGVGDGQIQYVIDQELSDVVSKASRIYNQVGKSKAGEPQIGFVIINKKTNTRFFSAKGRNYSNPLPGTVIDTVVTLPERYDFFLVSQSVGQGTVSPTYYNVIKDDFHPNRPDIIQGITFRLCHNYFNWSGTTRVPSVVQLAKKLAMLVGQHMHQAPSIRDIDHQLYFL